MHVSFILKTLREFADILCIYLRDRAMRNQIKLQITSERKYLITCDL